jgi:hypothetical protein
MPQQQRRPGWLTFSAVVMFAVCFIRIITAILYFRGGTQINDLTNSVFGNGLWAWGVWDLFLAGMAVIAGVSLLGGGGFGRLLGYIWAIWVIVQSFLIVNLVPWYAVTMIALGALVIYGLASTADWEAAS